MGLIKNRYMQKARHQSINSITNIMTCYQLWNMWVCYCPKIVSIRLFLTLPLGP